MVSPEFQAMAESLAAQMTQAGLRPGKESEYPGYRKVGLYEEIKYSRRGPELGGNDYPQKVLVRDPGMFWVCTDDVGLSHVYIVWERGEWKAYSFDDLIIDDTNYSSQTKMPA